MKIRIFFLFLTLFLGFAVMVTDLYTGDVRKEEVLMRIPLLMVLSSISFYIPPIFGCFKKKLNKYKGKKELRFLKKIFVLSAEIKPVDCMQVINNMYDRAEYFKTDLERIMDILRKSNVDKEDYFNELLNETSDIDTKLFFEKISIGILYDFDLAIKSIAGDFAQEKREYARFIKKRINLIHIVGVTGLFIAMTILLMYMLKPWLENLSIRF